MAFVLLEIEGLGVVLSGGVVAGVLAAHGLVVGAGAGVVFPGVRAGVVFPRAGVVMFPVVGAGVVFPGAGVVSPGVGEGPPTGGLPMLIGGKPSNSKNLLIKGRNSFRKLIKLSPFLLP